MDIILNCTSTNFVNYKISEPPRSQISQISQITVEKKIFALQKIERSDLLLLNCCFLERSVSASFFLTLSSLNFMPIKFFGQILQSTLSTQKNNLFPCQGVLSRTARLSRTEIVQCRIAGQGRAPTGGAPAPLYL